MATVTQPRSQIAITKESSKLEQDLLVRIGSSDQSLNTVNDLIQSNRFDQAIEYLNLNATSATVFAWNRVIEALIECGRYNDVTQLGEKWEASLPSKESIREMNAATRLRLPNSHTYVMLLLSCPNPPITAELAFTHLEEWKLPVSKSIMRAVIDECIESGDLTSAMKWLTEMINKGLPRDNLTLSLEVKLIRCLVEDRATEQANAIAISCWTHIQQIRMKPPVPWLETFMQVFCAASESKRVVELMRTVVANSYDIKECADLFDMIIDYLSDHKLNSVLERFSNHVRRAYLVDLSIIHPDVSFDYLVTSGSSEIWFHVMRSMYDEKRYDVVDALWRYWLLSLPSGLDTVELTEQQIRCLPTASVMVFLLKLPSPPLKSTEALRLLNLWQQKSSTELHNIIVEQHLQSNDIERALLYSDDFYPRELRADDVTLRHRIELINRMTGQSAFRGHMQQFVLQTFDQCYALNHQMDDSLLRLVVSFISQQGDVERTRHLIQLLTADKSVSAARLSLEMFQSLFRVLLKHSASRRAIALLDMFPSEALSDVYMTCISLCMDSGDVTGASIWLADMERRAIYSGDLRTLNQLQLKLINQIGDMNITVDGRAPLFTSAWDRSMSLSGLVHDVKTLHLFVNAFVVADVPRIQQLLDHVLTHLNPAPKSESAQFFYDDLADALIQHRQIDDLDRLVAYLTQYDITLHRLLKLIHQRKFDRFVERVHWTAHMVTLNEWNQVFATLHDFGQRSDIPPLWERWLSLLEQSVVGMAIPSWEVLSVLIKQPEFTLTDLLQRIHGCGVVMDGHTYAWIIHQYTKQNDDESALAVMRDMQTFDIPMNPRTVKLLVPLAQRYSAASLKRSARDLAFDALDTISPVLWDHQSLYSLPLPTDVLDILASTFLRTGDGVRSRMLADFMMSRPHQSLVRIKEIYAILLEALWSLNQDECFYRFVAYLKSNKITVHWNRKGTLGFLIDENTNIT